MYLNCAECLLKKGVAQPQKLRIIIVKNPDSSNGSKKIPVKQLGWF